MDTTDYSTLETGVVCRRNLSAYLVMIGEKTVSCTVSPRCAFTTAAPQSLSTAGLQAVKAGRNRCAPPTPVVGDRVRIQLADCDAGWITEILPRRNTISRRAAGSSSRNPSGQILSANIDQVVAFCAVDRVSPEWHLLDRFLALAEVAGIPAAIFLSKADLLPSYDPVPEEIRVEIAQYRRIGYPLVVCSVKTGAGIGEARSILREKTSILLGKSGAGKSSLLNALYPEWRLRVGVINRFGEGRCTTSNAGLFPIESGGAVVDTPGLRTLELWGAEELNPAYAFREMRPFVGRCRFGSDCRHVEEPGCAIRRAVETGRVGARRFRSMLRLAEERP